MRIRPWNIIKGVVLAAVVAYLFVILSEVHGSNREEQPLYDASVKAYVNRHDSGGRTPIMYAARSGNVSEVRDLIAKGADVNARNNKGHTPLTYAADNGHTDVAGILLDNGADVNGRSNQGTTALMLASERGYEEIARLLLEHGADTELKQRGRYTALITAAYYGHPGIVKLLVENGANVNTADPDGKTPILYAFDSRRMSSAAILAEKGADCFVKDKDGFTPLYLATMQHYPEGVRAILNNLARAGKSDPQIIDSLLYASQEKSFGIVDIILDSGMVVDDGTGILEQVFVRMAFCGRPGLVKKMIKMGVNVDSADGNGDTALVVAARKGHVDVVDVLLDNGADIEKASAPEAYACDYDEEINDPETALIAAGLYDHLELAGHLIERGADVNHTVHGNSPLTLAKRYGYVEFEKILRDAGGVEIDGYGER